MATPLAQQDLTGKARIRNAALALYAEHGEDGTSMRRTADAAGVTVGLVVHHFGTKDGLREAIEDHVVDLFVEAIGSVPDAPDSRAVARERDAAVAEMLAANPAVVGYLRRSVLGLAGQRSDLLPRLTELAAQQVSRESRQAIQVMTRQLGQLLLQPMIDAMWSQLEGASEDAKPVLVVRVEDAPASSGP
ncbi:TetR/AcrR family transcriptional regulator [Janibacter sp. G368]|uniref:TetR/AcrR family transcriptional regulator n=1 Tax=Janibacter sp. G368 TaxID=3420441 RepID=UPI003D079822